MSEKKNLQVLYRGNGEILIEKQKKATSLICPDCREKMSKVYVSHDDMVVIAGYGSCGCQRPR